MVNFPYEVEVCLVNSKKGRIFKVPCQHGYYLFKLEKQLEKIDKSKYVLAKEMNTEYKVINRYAHGDLSRLDVEVLARLCNACYCKVEDLVEYIVDDFI